MMSGSPFDHPTPFILTIIQMVIVVFQFGWFREQFCTVLCPYARFQSVLMDANSLAVGYDSLRGEPRGKLRSKENAETKAGDCIDCGLCVRVCPTGIDIRNGLQLECIHCASCVDACDSVMDKIGKPRGLVRYDSENRLFRRGGKFVRPRIFVYALILLLIGSVFSYRLATRRSIEAQILRGGLDVPFTVAADGRITNHLTLRVQNKADVQHAVSIRVPDNLEIEALIPGAPFPVAAEKVQTIPLFINFKRELLVGGKLLVNLELISEEGISVPLQITLIGPG